MSSLRSLGRVADSWMSGQGDQGPHSDTMQSRTGRDKKKKWCLYADQDFKFGVGAAARLDKRTQTWFGMSYTDDLVETGSSRFITDRRAFSLFEPRLFNIDLFYETRRITANIEHQITAKRTPYHRASKYEYYGSFATY